MSELDEGTLAAFVDGELDPDSMRQVARAIAQDPEAQEKVRRLRLSIALVRAAMDRPEHREVHPDIVWTVEQAPARRSWNVPPKWRAMIALAASITLVIGLAGGTLMLTRGSVSTAFENRLLDEVADYHTVYARETEHLVEVSAARREHIETWLGRRLNRTLHVPDLADQGWKFEGARLLVVEGHPVAQFIYVRPGDEHRPLGLCIVYSAKENPGVRTRTRGELNLALWESKGYAYVLVGWEPVSGLAGLAAELSRKMQNS